MNCIVNHLHILLFILSPMSLANERIFFKPIAPVSLSIELLSDKTAIEQNRQQFRLQLTSHVTASFVIDMILPEGVKIISKIDDWHGLIKAGESKQFSFTVNNQQWKSGVIEASATLEINGNVQYATRASYSGNAGIVRSKTILSPARYTTRHGESIVEYRLPSEFKK